MAALDKIDLPDVKNIIVIASGKGGVGKSTVAANLAVTFARQGLKVALVIGVGEAAEKGLSVFNQQDHAVMDQFEEISGQLVQKLMREPEPGQIVSDS